MYHIYQFIPQAVRYVYTFLRIISMATSKYCRMILQVVVSTPITRFLHRNSELPNYINSREFDFFFSLSIKSERILYRPLTELLVGYVRTRWRKDNQNLSKSATSGSAGRFHVQRKTQLEGIGRKFFSVCYRL